MAQTTMNGSKLRIKPQPDTGHNDDLAVIREQTRETVALLRQGVEGTLSQAVRAFGLRRARYRGLAKTGLQGVTTAAALNLDRITAWFAGRPLAPTRISRFATLAA